MPWRAKYSWQREEWYEDANLKNAGFEFHRIVLFEDLAILLGRATGVLPAIWFFAMFSLATLAFILMFEAYEVFLEDKPFLEYPGVLLIAPMSAAIYMIGWRRRAHWRLKD